MLQNVSLTLSGVLKRFVIIIIQTEVLKNSKLNILEIFPTVNELILGNHSNLIVYLLQNGVKIK